MNNEPRFVTLSNTCNVSPLTTNKRPRDDDHVTRHNTRLVEKTRRLEVAVFERLLVNDGLTTCILLFALSATRILPPESTANENGAFICPGAEPFPP